MSADRCMRHKRYVRGCRGCNEYFRVVHSIRRRLQAYGRWQSLVDAESARVRLAQLNQAGMSTRQVSALTGVSRYSLICIRRGQSRVSAYIADAILACPVKPSNHVDAIGVVRRLQALGMAGYGNEEIARRLGRRPITVAHWRNAKPGQVVTRQTHKLVGQLYGELWDTEGPSVVARRYAQKAGFQPFEAWTDRTIDDPEATPYGDSDALGFIDEELLHRVRSRERQFLDLSPAEQRVLYAAHIKAGGTPRGFRDRYRPVPITILRQLQDAV